MAVRRYDAGKLQRARKTDHGFLVAPARIARVGVQAYRDGAGGVRHEFRPPEEVFHPDSLASFSLAPITDDHPPEFVTAANARQYARGAMGEAVAPEGDFVAGTLVVHDAGLVEKLERGDAVEVSCGYLCDVVEEAGEYRGQRYTHRQTNIRGNHVAVVPKGRAGPEVRVRLDSADAVSLSTEAAPPPPPGGPMAVKVKVGGVEFEASEQLAQALAVQESQRAAELDALKASAQKADAALVAEKARADAAQAKADAAEKARKDAEDPSLLQKLVQQRVALETQARGVLGDVKLDGMDEGAVRLAVLAKLDPDFKPEGHSPEYVRARYDAELKHHARTNAAHVKARVAAGALPTTDAAEDPAEAFKRASREAWQRKPEARK